MKFSINKHRDLIKYLEMYEIEQWRLYRLTIVVRSSFSLPVHTFLVNGQTLLSNRETCQGISIKMNQMTRSPIDDMISKFKHY